MSISVILGDSTFSLLQGASVRHPRRILSKLWNTPDSPMRLRLTTTAKENSQDDFGFSMSKCTLSWFLPSRGGQKPEDTVPRENVPRSLSMLSLNDAQPHTFDLSLKDRGHYFKCIQEACLGSAMEEGRKPQLRRNLVR